MDIVENNASNVFNEPLLSNDRGISEVKGDTYIQIDTKTHRQQGELIRLLLFSLLSLF